MQTLNKIKIKLRFELSTCLQLTVPFFISIVSACSTIPSPPATSPTFESLEDRLSQEEHYTENFFASDRGAIRAIFNKLNKEDSSIKSWQKEDSSLCYTYYSLNDGVFIREHPCDRPEITTRSINETALRSSLQLGSLEGIRISPNSDIALLFREKNKPSSRTIIVNKYGTISSPEQLKKIFDVTWDLNGDLVAIQIQSELPNIFLRYNPTTQSISYSHQISEANEYLHFVHLDNQTCITQYPKEISISCFKSGDSKLISNSLQRKIDVKSIGILHTEKTFQLDQDQDVKVTVYQSEKVGRARPTIFKFYGAYDSKLDDTFEPSLKAFTDEGFAIAYIHLPLKRELKGVPTGRIRCLQIEILSQVIKKMISQGISSRERNVIWSRSAGAYLIGAILALNNENFAAAILEAPLIEPYNLKNEAKQMNYEVAEWSSLQEPETLACSKEVDFLSKISAETPPILISASKNDELISISDILKQISNIRARSREPVVLITLNTTRHLDLASSPSELSWLYAKMVRFISRYGNNPR